MPTKLMEAAFLAVDLKSIFNKPEPAEAPAMPGAQNEPDAVEQPAENTDGSLQTPQTSSAWGEELDRRLAANRQLSREARQTDYEVEDKFFKEYFKTFWDAECAKQLVLMGEPLKKALKVIGFDEKINPILAFLMDDYVKSSLIRTKLLNAVTFKAIYNAVAQKLVAQRQFFKSNNYNIIYCQDLYKKPLEEIMDYLKLQSSADLLPYSGKANANKNKKVFLALPEATAKAFSERLTQIRNTDTSNKSVKTLQLNSVAFAKELRKKLDGKGVGNETKVHLDNTDLVKLAQKLNTPAKKLAALQFLSMTTDSAQARAALANEKFGEVSKESLMKASVQIAGILPKDALATKDADALVGLIINEA